jgi:anti-sigma factor RsiW
MKMKCKKIGELILDYQDGLLAEPEKAELERHLRSCAACSSRWDEIRKIGGLLHADVPVVPAADFAGSWQRIAAAVAPAPPRRF